MPGDVNDVPDKKFILMYNMLTGIRIGVSRCENKQDKPLDANDYVQAYKLAFDISGQELTPTQKYDFKFKDYAPLVFRKLRQYFRVDVNDYLHSLTGKYVLSERGSPGKSGSFFYFSHDYRFIIKTIHHVEHKLLLKILPSYVEHVQKYPHTLLSRFFGLHRVKEPGGRKIHFVVMQNLFPPNKDVHEIYDLKGSTFGRFINESEAKGKQQVLKDLNWRDKQKHLELGPKKRAWLFKQLEIDVELLIKLEIMDYSLLIGVHNVRRGNIDHLRESMLKVLEPDPNTFKGRRTTMGFQQKSPSAELPHRKTLDIPTTIPPPQSASQPTTPFTTPQSPSRPASPFGTSRTSKSKLSMVRRAFTATDDEIEKLASTPSSPNFPQEMIFNERKFCVFYMDDGGYMSTSEIDENTQELYFVGIIDILTPFDMKKRSESFFKRLVQDKYGVSAVKPSFYGERFFNFMRTLTVNQSIPTNMPEFPPLPILESKLKELQENQQPLSLVQAFQKSNNSNYGQPRKPKASQIATSKDSSLSKPVEPIIEMNRTLSPDKLEILESVPDLAPKDNKSA